METKLHHVMARTTGLSWQQLDDEIVILDLNEGIYLSLNGAGATLWPLIVQGMDTPKLREALVDTFGISATQAMEDVNAFVATLEEHKLVEIVV